jgi:hypothetical protein
MTADSAVERRLLPLFLQIHSLRVRSSYADSLDPPGPPSTSRVRFTGMIRSDDLRPDGTSA